MKKQTTINLLKMNKEQTDYLTTVVSETIATDFVPLKLFTAADLWNIQRRGKTIMNRRHLS